MRMLSLFDSMPKFAATLTSFAFAITGIKWMYNKLYKWYYTEALIYGFFDCPSVNRADYYIILKSKDNYSEKNIKIILKLHVGLPSDYKITVQEFYTLARCEHLQTIRLYETSIGEKKEAKFTLPANKKYRIIVEAPLQYQALFCNNYDLILEVDEDIALDEKPLTPADISHDLIES